MSLKRFIEEAINESNGKLLQLELIRSSRYKPTWNISVTDSETNKRVKIFSFESAHSLQSILDILIESKLPVTLSRGYLIETKTKKDFINND